MCTGTTSTYIKRRRIAKKKVGERLKTCHNIKWTDAASATVCYFIYKTLCAQRGKVWWNGMEN